jgi:hypothetical protein
VIIADCVVTRTSRPQSRSILNFHYSILGNETCR